MNKYFLLSLVVILFLAQFVSAATVNISIVTGNADGHIQNRGLCSAIVSNTATLMSVGVDGANKCLPPPPGQAKASRYHLYLSFNTSAYASCDKSSAKIWYYVDSIEKTPKTFNWLGTYSSAIDYVFANNKIGTTLDVTDYMFSGGIDGSLGSIPSGAGWNTLVMNVANVTSGITDVELRPNNDYFLEMNNSGKRYLVVVRASEYTGTTYDPKLQLTYTCPTPPTVNITSPLNQTYFENPIWLNWTHNITMSGENLSGAWYSLDNGTNISLLGTVYQEQGNVMKISGAWSSRYPSNRVNDSNWATYGAAEFHGLAEYFVNYTKPSGASSSSRWIVWLHPSASNAHYNVTVPSSCWALSPLQFKVNLTQPNYFNYQSFAYCKNTTGWVKISTTTTGNDNYLVEDAMEWHGVPMNISLNFTEGHHNITVCVNDTNNLQGCDSVSFAVFFKSNTLIMSSLLIFISILTFLGVNNPTWWPVILPGVMVVGVLLSGIVSVYSGSAFFSTVYQLLFYGCLIIIYFMFAVLFWRVVSSITKRGEEEDAEEL